MASKHLYTLDAGGTSAQIVDYNALRRNEAASDSNKLGGKAPEYYIQPRNLLDNSDFTNPVNQAGLGSFHGGALHALDRWLYNGTSDQLSLNNGTGLSYSNNFVTYQRIGNDNILDGGIYTIALWTSDGMAYCAQLMPSYIPIGTSGYSICHNNENVVYIHNTNATLPIAHVALYKGTYTAETLPLYIPKGYATELAECRRYWQQLNFICYTKGNTQWIVPCLRTYPMRISPTIIIKKVTLNGSELDVSQMCGYYNYQFNNLESIQDFKNQFGTTNMNIVDVYVELNADI